MNNVEKQHQNLNKVMHNKMSKQIANPVGNSALFPKCSNTTDFLTQKANINLDGHDVSGCRLDKNQTLQTGSMYGPPLAWCDTYDKSKLQKTGTLWYPLN
jgi:hypothetical protein